MTLSRRAVETLVDLVEIKLSCLEVFDREDSRELTNLQACLDELSMMKGGQTGQAEVIAIGEAKQGRPLGAASRPKPALRRQLGAGLQAGTAIPRCTAGRSESAPNHRSTSGNSAKSTPCHSWRAAQG